ncbi:MAG: hypothetical protein ACI8ZF_000929 [Candidatus Midichloriaceae bacterium]|jgi:hypothetical protein
MSHNHTIIGLKEGKKLSKEESEKLVQYLKENDDEIFDFDANYDDDKNQNEDNKPNKDEDYKGNDKNEELDNDDNAGDHNFNPELM